MKPDEIEKMRLENATAKILLRRVTENEDAVIPDSGWWRDYLLFTGEHWFLSDEGWEPGETMKHYREDDPEWEPLDEVNAPVAAS